MSVGFKADESEAKAYIQINGFDIAEITQRGIETPVSFLSGSDVVEIDFLQGPMQIHPNINQDFEYTTTNLAEGRNVEILLRNVNPSDYTIVFPSDWTFVGSAMPSSITAETTAVLKVSSFGTQNNLCIAEWKEEA